jgi:hypothetical protein
MTKRVLLMKKIWRLCFILVILVLIAFILPLAHRSFAQDETIELRMSRTWGYGGIGEIQGLFTLKASGADGLSSVTFLIDDEVMEKVTEPPFEHRFNTDDYPLGEHTLSARGETMDGRELGSNTITTRFVSAEAGWQSVLRLLIPMFVIIAGAFLISFLVTFYAGRSRINPPAGAQRQYGVTGGAICPKCSRPTPLHWFGLNLLMWKYDRCENCLKWSAMKHLPVQVLRQAEADELAQARQAEGASLEPFLTEEERLKKEIEDSRFQELR